MTVTVYGVATSINAPQWSQLLKDLGDAGASMAVPSGLKVSVAGGTRQVNVAAGRSLQAGSNLVSTAATTLTLAANSGSNPRRDTIVARVDFNLTSSAAGSIVVRQGAPAATPVAPTLTQVAGGVWETPLADVIVDPGATSLSAAKIIDRRTGNASGDPVAVSVPGNFSADSVLPLQVQKSGGLVEFSGRFNRTVSTVQVGDVTINGSVIIPQGFRPQRTVQLAVYSNVQSGVKAISYMEIDPDGSANLWPFTAPITNGTTLRVQTTNWIGA